MTFAAFVDLCRRLEGTRSRHAKLALTAEFLRQLPREEIGWTIAFLTGRPFPTSDPRLLEVGGATLAELRDTVGSPPPTSTLALPGVARAFEAVAAARGPASRRKKSEAMAALLGSATADEREILGRIVRGEMRIGLHEGLVQDATAAAAGVDPKLVRRALLFVSDPALVAETALADGERGLREIGIRLFVPLLPMLAEPTEDATVALAAHGGRTALEFKYDGARIQIHRAGSAVRIWSRRLTEVTPSLPDVVAIAQRELKVESCIVDGEVVAVGADGRPLPFQELMRRFRRVHEIETSAQEVPLALHLFDCLFLDGRSLIDEPYDARWTALTRVTPAAYVARRVVASDAGAARAFLAEALAAGHEGIVAKALDRPYTPGRRGRRWFKIKPAETLDCVIVAADRGSGRRRGWLSNYHLAVRDPAGGFAPVGKTFKGLTDREFAQMTARLQGLAVGDDGYTVTVTPAVVVDVAYNEIQRSPQYPSGFALRFARITRIREDKSPREASTLAEVRALYDRQFDAKGRVHPLTEPEEP